VAPAVWYSVTVWFIRDTEYRVCQGQVTSTPDCGEKKRLKERK